MVHVNVGLANCVMGLINAASENIPMVVIAGRTPITEHQRLGSRMTPIQYGQEMRDQSAMIRELVYFDLRLGPDSDRFKALFAEVRAGMAELGVVMGRTWMPMTGAR